MVREFEQNLQDHQKERVRKIFNNAWNQCHFQDHNKLVFNEAFLHILRLAIPTHSED